MLGLANYRLIRSPEPDLPFIHKMKFDDIEFPFWITDSHTRSWWFKEKQNETAEVYFLRNFNRQSSVSLDVGAHHGYQSMLMALTAANCQVYSFEANPVCALTLNANIALNRLTNVSANLLAIGAEKRTIDIKGQSLAANSLDSWSVPMMSLDDYCRENGINDVGFMKVDVEGYEGEVLKGATAILENRPHINLELHLDDVGTFGWDAKDILDLIPVNGSNYEISWVDRAVSWTDRKDYSSLDLTSQRGVVNIFFVNKAMVMSSD